jgi:pilus assembly protein CpaC
MIRKKCIRPVLLAIGLLLSLQSFAQDIYLEPGDSTVIKTDRAVDTVFISADKVADYDIISEHNFVVYGKSDGHADIIAFDASGNQIMSMGLTVDSTLGSIQKKIKRIVPQANVQVDKIGKSYVISGTVPTEEAHDLVYQIVGEGVASERKEYFLKDQDDKETRLPWTDITVYRNVIDNIEQPHSNQVNVKLSIVEVTKEFTDNLGIDWASVGETAGSFHFIKLNADTINGLIHAIANDSVARVLAEPNLSVVSGAPANFLVGGSVPLVTSSLSGTSVEYKDYGIGMVVDAKVKDKNNIRLTLKQEFSSIDTSYNVGGGSTLPALRTRNAATTVDLADGQSFVLGGLISNEERESLSRIPFIGEIPILGSLFRNTSTSRSRRELVIVATVNLVKPISNRDVVLPDYQRSATLARLLNINGIEDRHQRRMASQFIKQGGFIK